MTGAGTSASVLIAANAALSTLFVSRRGTSRRRGVRRCDSSHLRALADVSPFPLSTLGMQVCVPERAWRGGPLHGLDCGDRRAGLPDGGRSCRVSDLVYRLWVATSMPRTAFVVNFNPLRCSAVEVVH